MTAQVGDMVLENFKVGEDDFRDLDSVVRQHCETVTYYVHKGRSLGDYETDSVEDIMKDRNGVETRIKSVMLRATGANGLRFNIEFDDEIVMNGECSDRAPLILLATDAGSVIRDRMKGRKPKRKIMLQAIAVVFFILGYSVFLHIQDSYTSRFNAEQTAQVSRSAVAADRKQGNADMLSIQRQLSQAAAALSKHDLNAEIDFLVQQRIGQLRQELTSDQAMAAITSSSDMPSDPTPPWWSTSYWLLLAVACTAAAVAVGVGYLVISSSNSVFLIGDEKRRQKRADKFRTNMIWVVGVGFIVSIVSGLLLSLR
jgi:hypothetical protein